MTAATVRHGSRFLVAVLLLGGCASATSRPAQNLAWPLPPETARIKYLEAYSRRGHFGSQGSDRLKAMLLGDDGRSQERMLKPFAVTTDAKGRVYVTDTGLAAVWVFDGEKKEVRFLGDSGAGQLGTPSGVAVDARGVVFVADAQLDRVIGFDESGKVVLAIGEKEEFHSPAGLAADQASGRLYVATRFGSTTARAAVSSSSSASAERSWASSTTPRISPSREGGCMSPTP